MRSVANNKVKPEMDPRCEAETTRPPPSEELSTGRSSGGAVAPLAVAADVRAEERATAPPPSSEAEGATRTKSEIRFRGYKTPFEPFLAAKARFWPSHRVPRLNVPRSMLTYYGCPLEERLVAVHIDGTAPLDVLAALTGLDLFALCNLVGSMRERGVLVIE